MSLSQRIVNSETSSEELSQTSEVNVRPSKPPEQLFDLEDRKLSQFASVVIVTYNHREDIGTCIETALQNNPLEVIVVDNGSVDGTPEFIESNFEDVQVIRAPENLGYGAGVNEGVRHSKGSYIICLNPDTETTENAFNELLLPLTGLSETITIPKLLISDSERLNACGLANHFTGLTFTRGLHYQSSSFDEYKFVNGFSGACFAMNRETYDKLDGFDENLFLYMEDTELSWRALAMGFSILYVPTSVIYHTYDLCVDPKKIYHLEFGRYYLLQKYFGWQECLLLAPSLLMTESLTLGYSILQGPTGIKMKLKAMYDGIHAPKSEASCNSRALLRRLDHSIPCDQLSYTKFDKGYKLVSNVIYRLNWRVIRR